MIDFTEEQLQRYSRHILLSDIGIEGQEKILAGRVLVIGTGGLGSPVALYLAAAGVGKIGIVDSDSVELSNLQRQVIHYTKDIGRPKVESAAEKMLAINPELSARTYHEWIDAGNIRGIIRDGYDFVIDCTDNFTTKFLINDACIIERVAFSHGGVLQFSGQATTVIPCESACYRCVFSEAPPPDAVPTCAQAGVLGAVAGMLGTIQAVESLKFLAGAGSLLSDTLLTFDALTMNFRKVPLKRRKGCPVCGEHPSILELTKSIAPQCRT